MSVSLSPFLRPRFRRNFVKDDDAAPPTVNATSLALARHFREQDQIGMISVPYQPQGGPSPPFFEFDEAKSHANSVKHGIDFRQAQALWLDRKLVEIAARSEGESRFVVIGTIEGEHWSAVITYRRDAIRLISVRRSRIEEIDAYEDEGIR